MRNHHKNTALRRIYAPRDSEDWGDLKEFEEEGGVIGDFVGEDLEIFDGNGFRSEDVVGKTFCAGIIGSSGVSSAGEGDVVFHAGLEHFEALGIGAEIEVATEDNGGVGGVEELFNFLGLDEAFRGIGFALAVPESVDVNNGKGLMVMFECNELEDTGVGRTEAFVMGVGMDTDFAFMEDIEGFFNKDADAVGIVHDGTEESGMVGEERLEIGEDIEVEVHIESADVFFCLRVDLLEAEDIDIGVVFDELDKRGFKVTAPDIEGDELERSIGHKHKRYQRDRVRARES